MNFIGIDLGGTQIKAGIISKEGKVIGKTKVDTPVKEGINAIVDAIYGLIDRLLKTNKLDLQSIKGIGIGIPGVCNSEGLVYYATNLFWTNVPLGQMLKEKINIPIFVENDATIAAIGESTCGATRGSSNSIFITLGTGVGGGFIINGDVYSGNHGIGSEIGHMMVGKNFYDCNCGSNGCLETFASGTALVKYTKKLLEDPSNSLILKKLNNNMDLLDARLIFDCAKEGDLVANKAVDRLVKYLSIGIANLINLLDPEIIAIGGGMSRAGDFLLDKLNNEVPKYIWLKSMNLTKIVLASLQNDAGIVGAGMYARGRLGL